VREVLFVGPMQILARRHRVTTRCRALARTAGPLGAELVRGAMEIR
jgi:hypothetical protein